MSLASGGAVQASAPTGTSTRKFRRLTTVEMDSYLRDASVAGGVLEQVAQRLRPKAASAPADPQPVSAEPRTGDASITPSPAVDSADGGDALLAAFPCVDVEMERVLGRAGPGAEAEGTAGSIPETHDMGKFAGIRRGRVRSTGGRPELVLHMRLEKSGRCGLRIPRPPRLQFTTSIARTATRTAWTGRSPRAARGCQCCRWAMMGSGCWSTWARGRMRKTSGRWTTRIRTQVG